jgi:hypothetical protein
MSGYSNYLLGSVRGNNKSPKQVYDQQYKLVQEYQLKRFKNMQFVLNLIEQKIRKTRVHTEDPVQKEFIRRTVGILMNLEQQIRKDIVGDSMIFLGALERVLKFEGLN